MQVIFSFAGLVIPPLQVLVFVHVFICKPVDGQIVGDKVEFQLDAVHAPDDEL